MMIGKQHRFYDYLSKIFGKAYYQWICQSPKHNCKKFNWKYRCPQTSNVEVYLPFPGQKNITVLYHHFTSPFVSFLISKRTREQALWLLLCSCQLLLTFTVTSQSVFQPFFKDYKVFSHPESFLSLGNNTI